jgi:N-acetylglutamate synthase-like GNAT family acetyltransferase
MHAPATPPRHAPDDVEFLIRTFGSADASEVAELFETGILAGQLAPNDTAADMDNILDAYLADPRHHFWVAVQQTTGDLVGMIGVASDEHDTAEIRRLRVRQDHQHGPMPGLLLETALNHCRKHSYLKVRLDTRFERCDALATFERIGFRHTRDRVAPGKDVLEFYVDLYRSPDDEPGHHAPRDPARPNRPSRKSASRVKVS